MAASEYSSRSARPPSGPSWIAEGQIFAERYLIEARLGSGGTGHVFRARDLRLGRAVALKALRSSGTSGDMVSRFQREAELSRTLSHPNSVRMYDFGVSSSGIPFITFELLQGESLSRRLKRTGPFTSTETRRIAISLLKSLMEAHELGIVHRDIKPSNVFLCDYAGETDFVKLLDFGTAKAPQGVQLTARGWLIGTPQFMAPEQIGGRELTPRADVYALGLLMATLLAGGPLLSGDLPDLLGQQLSPEPLPLPGAVVGSPLFAVIRRATQKDPALRFASAREMLAELAACDAVDSAEPARVTSAPIAYSLAAPLAAESPERRVLPALYYVLGLLLLVATGAAFFAGNALAHALEPSSRPVETALDDADPSFTPAMLAPRAERAGLSLGAARRVAPHVIELPFEHATALGVLRIDERTSVRQAREAERECSELGRCASARRGHRVLSVWAAPRGAAHFDRARSAALLDQLVTP